MPGISGQSAELAIMAKVYGEQDLTKLRTQLENLKKAALSYSDVKKMTTAQTNLEIQQLKMSNTTLRARSTIKADQMRQLAQENAKSEIYQHNFQKRFDLEKNAYILQRQYKSEGIDITIQEAMVAQLAGDKIILIEKQKQIEMNNTRKTLMAASISMFVLNISMGQLVQSIKPFVKGNEDLEKSVEDVSNALRFSMAPLQAYMALQMISKSIAIEQRAAYLGVASALGAIFFLYEAITSKSAGVRAAYAGIATALFAVAIASWMANVALATGKTLLLGDFKAFGVVAAGVAASAAIVAGLTAPKAQTLTGHTKTVRKGGMAILDDDEVVSRVSKDGTKSGDGGGDINIYLPDSYMGTLSDAKVTAETVRRYTQTGQGSIQFKRKVASNG